MSEPAASGRDVQAPVLVELYGLPGSGKSSVFEALLRRDPRTTPRPVLSRPPYAHVLAFELASALALLVRRRSLRGRTFEQVRVLAYLQGLPRVLRGPRLAGRIVLFDQGPLYFLARPSIRDARLADWRSRMLEEWRRRLDLVVVLDAPEAVLRERIESRGAHHRLRGQPPGSVRDVLAKTRELYEDVLASVAGDPEGPAILRLDTSACSVDEAVAEVLAAVAGRRGPTPHGEAVAARP